MPPALTTKTAADVGYIRRARRGPASGTLGRGLLIPTSAPRIVLTLQGADRKLETLAHEALTILGQLMWGDQEAGVRLNAAAAVLRAWQQSKGSRQ